MNPKFNQWIKEMNELTDQELLDENKKKELEIHNLELQIFIHRLFISYRQTRNQVKELARQLIKN